VPPGPHAPASAAGPRTRGIRLPPGPARHVPPVGNAPKGCYRPWEPRLLAFPARLSRRVLGREPRRPTKDRGYAKVRD
jgi:hypothetical protein